MNDILIKGVEMPTSCHDCRFCGWSNFWQAYACHMTKNHALLLFNGEKTNSDSKTRNGIADNCPLVPVPPHGRLIDADALDTSILQAGFSYAITRRKLRYTPGEVREKIANAPTIIPAEEGEGSREE